METKEYLRFVDPGHSWLRVALEEVMMLGIYTKISEYSPTLHSGKHKSFIYLEEDCDMGLFLDAMEKRNVPIKIVDVDVDNFDEYLHKDIELI